MTLLTYQSHATWSGSASTQDWQPVGSVAQESPSAEVLLRQLFEDISPHVADAPSVAIARSSRGDVSTDPADWVLSASTTSYSTARESGAEFSLAAYLAKVAELAEKFESDMVDIASSDLLRRYYKNDYCNELQL